MYGANSMEEFLALLKECFADPKEFYNVVLVFEKDPLFRSMLKASLESESYAVISKSSFRNIDRRADVLVTKIDEYNLEKVQRIREKYSADELHILALVPNDLFEKTYNSLRKVALMPSYVSFEDIVDNINHYWKDTLFNRLKKDLPLYADSFVSIIEESLYEHDFEVLQERVHVMQAFLPEDKRTWNIISKIFAYAQKNKVEIPEVQVSYSDVISTDDVSKPRLHDKLAGIAFGVCFKKFSDEMRAKTEYEWLQGINEKNKAKAWGRGIQINAPKVGGDLEKRDNEIYLAELFIKGPTLRELSSQLTEAEKKGDLFAKYFKRAVFFEMNKYLALLQENPIDLEKKIKTPFAEFTKQSLIDNLKFFNLEKTIKEKPHLVETLELCIDSFYETLEPFEPVPFVDNSAGNIMFRVLGNANATLKDIKDKFDDTDLIKTSLSPDDVYVFVKRKFFSIDFNKTFFQTHFIEDLRHGYPNLEISEEERKVFDYHFLLWRKKAKLIKKSNEITEEEQKIDEVLANFISYTLSEADFKFVENECKADLAAFNDAEPVIRFYRSAYWFNHLLKKYLPKEHKKFKEAYEEMSGLFYEKNKSILTTNLIKFKENLSKFFETHEENSSTNLLQRSFVQPKVINEELYDYLPKENVNIFVKYANALITFGYNELNYEQNLEFYFDESYDAISTIIKSLSQKYASQMPSLKSLERYAEFIKKLREENINENDEKRLMLRYASARVIKYVMDVVRDKIKTGNKKGINYSKLIKTPIRTNWTFSDS